MSSGLGCHGLMRGRGQLEKGTGHETDAEEAVECIDDRINEASEQKKWNIEVKRGKGCG